MVLLPLVPEILAYAAPLSPDFANCVDATEPDGTSIDCCPPEADITDFVPSTPTVSGIRPAAQSVDSTYIRNYKKAIDKMKNLSSTDPRNFTQQANVHCAYCNSGYRQEGYPNLVLDVHNSWLFCPFHRWYLYFFERICQNLLDDDTFAIPFWQWDDPSGMNIPSIFTDTSSPLYDSLRDLSFGGTDQNLRPITQIKNNLFTMYRQMVVQSTTPTRFFGEAFVAGQAPDPGAGSIESSPHNNVHLWTGVPSQSQREAMGTFYSAGRDPIFYAHHANVDRMWTIYNSLLGGKNLANSDWLNSSFIFYNEKAKPVRVTVKDSLDTSKLGYSYENVRILWLDYRPRPRRTAITLPTAPKVSEVFPGKLEKTVIVTVKRPRKSRTRKEKEAAEEVLVIDGIEYNSGELVQFDVFVNEDTPGESGPDNTEFVGSFVNLPHGHRMSSKTSRSFVLNEVLEELGADDFDNILVALVPKSGVVTINSVKIKCDYSNQNA